MTSLDTIQSLFSQSSEPIQVQLPSAFEWINHMNRLKQDGYTIFKNSLPTSIFDELNNGFDQLKSADLLPVGIIYHPLFWQITMALDPLIQHILQEPYVILPETWAWDIAPHKANKGWAPHREKLYSCVKDDGLPVSVSCWFPITPATPENSCMYVIPAGDDPFYPVGKTHVEIPFQSIRALPALPGDVIVFNHNILHWGSQSSQWATTPRRAIAFETQISRLKPYNTPVTMPHTQPDFKTCQALYEQLIGQYDHIDGYALQKRSG